MTYTNWNDPPIRSSPGTEGNIFGGFPRMGDPPSIPTDATDVQRRLFQQVFALLAARMISASHVQAWRVGPL